MLDNVGTVISKPTMQRFKTDEQIAHYCEQNGYTLNSVDCDGAVFIYYLDNYGAYQVKCVGWIAETSFSYNIGRIVR